MNKKNRWFWAGSSLRRGWLTCVCVLALNLLVAQEAPVTPAAAAVATPQPTPTPATPSPAPPAAATTSATDPQASAPVAPLPGNVVGQPAFPRKPKPLFPPVVLPEIPVVAAEKAAPTFPLPPGTPEDSLRRPYAYFKEEVMMRFSVWSLDKELLVTPFALNPETRRTKITHVFDLDAFPATDLFLYIIDAGCQVEVELNGRYLGVDSNPLAPFVVALRKDWLKLTGNEVRLWLEPVSPPDFYPDGSIGLMQPVYLLNSSQLSRLNRPIMETALVTDRDTIGIVAPYYGPSGYHFDAYYALAALDPLRRFGIRKVYFPFPPSRKMQAFCAQMGFAQVKAVPANARVCWVNTFPRARHNARYPGRFWLDTRNHNTAYFGNFTRYQASHIKKTNRQEVTPFLVLLVFLPLLILMGIRLVNPGFQQTLWPMFVQPKLYVDVYANNSLGFAGVGMMLAFVRVLLNAITLTLTLRGVQQYQAWDWLNLFFDPSLVNRLIHTDASLLRLFGWSLLIFVGTTLIRYMMASAISTVYNVRDFVGGVIALDILGAFPLTFALPFLPAVALFVSPEWVMWPISGYALLLAVHWGRGIYTTYIGLGRLFNVSAGMKILYICGLNLLPYLFWL